jgi:hypothetical protein
VINVIKHLKENNILKGIKYAMKIIINLSIVTNARKAFLINLT